MNERTLPAYARMIDGPMDKPNAELRVLIKSRGRLYREYVGEVVEVIEKYSGTSTPKVGQVVHVFGRNLEFEDGTCTPTI